MWWSPVFDQKSSVVISSTKDGDKNKRCHPRSSQSRQPIVDSRIIRRYCEESSVTGDIIICSAVHTDGTHSMHRDAFPKSASPCNCPSFITFLSHSMTNSTWLAWAVDRAMRLFDPPGCRKFSHKSSNFVKRHRSCTDATWHKTPRGRWFPWNYANCVPPETRASRSAHTARHVDTMLEHAEFSMLSCLSWIFRKRIDKLIAPEIVSEVD